VREDNDEIGHYVGLLRRILILFAVIIAVPVILWTTTALIRYRVRLPDVLNFQKPLATASINAPERATTAEPTQQQSTPRQAKFTDPQEARATERAAPDGSSFVEHPLDAPPSAPSATQTPDTSSALAAISNSATPMVEKGAHGLLLPFASNDGATAGTNGTMQPAAASRSGCAPRFGPAFRTDPAASAETSRRNGPHSGYNAVTCAEAATPPRGKRLRHTARNDDQRPFRPAAAISAVDILRTNNVGPP
jgi:hypothetical protein